MIDPITRWCLITLVAAFGLQLFLDRPTSTYAQDAGKAKAFASAHEHDFRGKPLPDWLVIFGDRQGMLTKEEKEGFRITLPKDRESFQSVTVRTKFAIAGDFELTAAFEILEAEEPEQGGWGVGVTMRIEKAESPEAATIARLVCAKGTQVAFWDRSFLNKEGQLKFEGQPKPCKESTLRLRLKRSGATLQYLWAPGASGGEFVTLKTLENFGAENLKHVGVNVTTGKMPAKVDVRLLDFRVDSGGAIAAAAPLAVQTRPNADVVPPPASRGWLALILLLGMGFTVLMLLGLGAWVYLRQRANAEQPATPTTVKAKGAKE